jgi:hypothetical protein
MQLWSVAHFHPHFWVGATANSPKSEDGNGQLTRVAFKINDSYEIHTLEVSIFLWHDESNAVRVGEFPSVNLF